MSRSHEQLSPELRTLLKKLPLGKRSDGDRVLRGDLDFGSARYKESALGGSAEHWQVFLAIEAELGRALDSTVAGLAPDHALAFARWCFRTGRADLGVQAFQRFAASPDAALEEEDVLEYLAEVEGARGKAGMVEAADALLPRMRSDRVLSLCVQAASSLGDLAGAQARLVRWGDASSTLAAGVLRVEDLKLDALASGAAPHGGRARAEVSQAAPELGVDTLQDANGDAPDTVAMAVPPTIAALPPPPPREAPAAPASRAAPALPRPAAPPAPRPQPLSPPQGQHARPGPPSAPAKHSHPVIGQLVGGRYQIEAFIAEGRLAQVFSALREGTPRHVALKVMLPAYAADAAAAARFLAGAKMGMRLSHPGVVPVFGSGEDRGWYFVASELVFGENLDSFVASRGPLPQADAVRFARELCAALAYAASVGVLHGGLRPSNVFLSRDLDAPEIERVRVADFGMTDVDRAAMLVDGCTPPDLLRGEPVTVSSDVYTIGALLYQMLTGARLFAGVAEARVEHAVLHNPPPRPANADRLDAALLRLVARCLRKTPAERPASAAQLATELAAIEKTLGSSAADGAVELLESTTQDDTQTGLHPVREAQRGRFPLLGRELAGRFRVVSFMRAGGMAQLYYGTQSAEPRRIAIKVMHPELARVPEIVRRFTREAQLAAQLDHPNIVRLIHVGDDRELPFLAMELLSGEDLSVRIRQRGRVAESQAADIGIAVARALAYAHQRGVVHRDIKPGNVMICSSDELERVKLLDFGIAKVLDGDPAAPGSALGRSAITTVGDLVGTPRYMSPEQGRAEPVDHRADLYSLGVVLYELVTGEVPFDGETALQIVARHVQDEPRPPSALVPDLHPGLERLILELLRKPPDARPASAAIVADTLEALRSQLASSPSASTHRWMEDSKTSGPRTGVTTRRALDAVQVSALPPVPEPAGPEDDELPTRANDLDLLPPNKPAVRTVAMQAQTLAPDRLPPAPQAAPTVAAREATPPEGGRNIPRTMVAASHTARMVRDEVLREAQQFMAPQAGAITPPAGGRYSPEVLRTAKMSDGPAPAPPIAVPVSTGPIAPVAPIAPAPIVAPLAPAAADADRRALEAQVARLHRTVQILIALVVLALVLVVIVVVLK